MINNFNALLAGNPAPAGEATLANNRGFLISKLDFILSQTFDKFFPQAGFRRHPAKPGQMCRKDLGTFILVFKANYD